MAKKKVKRGRPPLPPDEKRVRIHISVPPEMAERAMKDPDGPSAYFERAVQSHRPLR